MAVRMSLGNFHPLSLSVIDFTPAARAFFLKAAIHLTDKLYILERENEKAIKIYGNEPNGLPMVGIPPGLKSERNIRGTLKEAIEKNNALRRLKSRFEGSTN
ncbi:hypothetical protein AVEN_35594-1 [Araneus ventricosus]|uniref:Uncharacterized protein n=1 Tax=Araneus ventricosus TaxID=182803 RepID=A0A4Y2CJ32_ARAVE|nr:hypothetical protein AVEN_35594-1 [Araneus ventricosus]